jgi:hypothetical protein
VRKDKTWDQSVEVSDGIFIKCRDFVYCEVLKVIAGSKGGISHWLKEIALCATSVDFIPLPL